MSVSKSESMETVEDHLRKIVSNKGTPGSRHIDTLMALSKCLELAKKFKESLATLNDTVALYKSFLPPLIEKAKVLFHLTK